MSVRFLGTTAKGATIDAGPFTHINVTADGATAYAIDSAEPVQLVVRERAKLLFEGALALESFDVTDDEASQPANAAPAPDEAEVKKPKRKYKRRKKATEAVEPEPHETTDPLQAAVTGELEAE